MRRSRMRRFLRFSTRTVMMVVLVAGIWLGWLVHAARIQRSAVTAIQNAGGQVWYSWQTGSLDDFRPNAEERPWWPSWVIDRFGVDLFSSVIKVELGGERTTDREMMRVGNLTRLEYLSVVGGGRLGTGGFKHLARLTNLRRLDLRSTSITDAGLSCVAGLDNLQELDLSTCGELTDAGLAHLKALRRLVKLVLEQTAITDNGIEFIENLTSLRELYLNGDSITDEGLARLKALNRLEVLGAHDCTAITDSGLVHLAGLSRLKALALSRSQVTDAGLRSLKGLTQLKYLDVSGAHVTDAGASELQLALPGLEIYNPDSVQSVTTVAPDGSTKSTKEATP